MGRNPSTLNEKQATVLRWIADGCPPGIYEQGYEHRRVVARALERRGLITITGRGPTWAAKVTKRGFDVQG